MKEPVIEITDLSKSYGKTKAIEHINLAIEEGEIFGFIGPNGAGKSTTIRILMNLIFPTAGSARIMGMDVIRKTKEIKRRVGYIPSDANAYSSMDVREFLAYCARFYNIKDPGNRITELTNVFELGLNRRIADLSMGNKKKVSIVQSLIHNPDLLIMDEPTSGLDPLMQSTFFDLLRSENRKGLTIFFSSHTLSEIQMFCKRVAIIRQGRIVQVEDIESLRKKQLKKVLIEFTGKPDITRLTFPGIESLKAGPGNNVSFMFSGDLNVLTRFLSGMDLANLMIEEPSLDEIFMHYYRA
jgi:ABC-2 type transport system ATP-binding protein